MVEMGHREFRAAVKRRPLVEQRRLDELLDEWTQELTGYVDEMPCPVYQARGRLVVVSIRLADEGPDLIEVHERSDSLQPLMGPDGEFVYRWIETPVPVPEQVRALIAGAGSFPIPTDVTSDPVQFQWRPEAGDGG